MKTLQMSRFFFLKKKQFNLIWRGKIMTWAGPLALAMKKKKEKKKKEQLKKSRELKLKKFLD